jgi:hypothetical protein
VSYEKTPFHSVIELMFVFLFYGEMTGLSIAKNGETGICC